MKVGDIIYTSNPTPGWNGPLRVVGFIFGQIEAVRANIPNDPVGIILPEEVTATQPR